MESGFIERLDQYMNYAGLNDNKVTVQCGLSNGVIGKARKNKSVLKGENIEHILCVYKDINARWLLTGEGDMLSNENTAYSEGQLDVLKKINNDLMEKVESLNRQIAVLEHELKSLKKENVHLDMVADNADAEKYSLAK